MTMGELGPQTVQVSWAAVKPYGSAVAGLKVGRDETPLYVSVTPYVTLTGAVGPRAPTTVEKAEVRVQVGQSQFVQGGML